MQNATQKFDSSALLHLPLDILIKLMEELDFKSLLALSQTNRQLRNLYKQEYFPLMQLLFSMHQAAQVDEFGDTELALYNTLRVKFSSLSTRKNTQLIQYQFVCLNAWNKAKTPKCYGLGHQDVARLKLDTHQPAIFTLQAIMLSRIIYLIKYVDISDEKILSLLRRHESRLLKGARLAANKTPELTAGLMAIAVFFYYILTQYLPLPTMYELLTISTVLNTHEDQQVLITLMCIYSCFAKYHFNVDKPFDYMIDVITYIFLTLICYGQFFKEAFRCFNFCHNAIRGVTAFALDAPHQPPYSEFLCRLNIDNMQAANELFRRGVPDSSTLKNTINSVHMPVLSIANAPGFFRNIEREARQELDCLFSQAYLTN